MESLSTYLDFFMILKNSGKYSDSLALYNAVVSRLNLNLSDEDNLTLKEYCRRITLAITRKWKQANRKLECFLKEHKNWLETDIDWPSCIKVPAASGIVDSEVNAISPQPSTSTSAAISVGTMTKRKAPTRKPFQDLGKKQKRRRITDQENCESSEIAYAAIIKMRQEGKENIASALEFMLTNPGAADKFNNLIHQSSAKQVFTPEKALGIFLSLKLSKWQYITLRETAIREGVKDLYPSYYKVQQAKLQCYPSKQTITVTDSSAKISLQGLLDLTVKRIFDSLPECVEQKQLILISKWGFDGASSQSRYKQTMDSENDDSSVFMTSLVPLKLINGSDTIWKNPKPCSSSFCRPVRFSFMKESKLVVNEHLDSMKEEIKALRPTDSGSNKVTHDLKMTMIDGKVCTYISEAKASSVCYLCLAKPSEMNNLTEVLKRPVSENLYEFGLSSLHARINCMECLLNISYRQDLKKWMAKGEEDKAILQARKKTIQDGFKRELNLIIGVVKQGSGTTNDGNTARRFFEFPEKTAAITGLDENLIRRFAVILQAITSEENIYIEKFKEYCLKTAERYLALYNWYYMSSTVHKLLVHGADIIACNAVVPIGCLSEEASEARNKDFRRFRCHHSRKKSRQCSNEDILNMLLLTSDPLISSVRPIMDVKNRKALFAETRDLLDNLQEPDVEFCDINQLDSESESESECSDCD